MNGLVTRQSPIQHLLQSYDGHWGEIASTPVALRFDSLEIETRQMLSLGLCDGSALPKLGVKGPAAFQWLSAQDVVPPNKIYESKKLEDASRLVRLSEDEFLLEDSPASHRVKRLSEKLGNGQEGVARVDRQEATFLLTGSRASEVLSQTCAIDFRSPRLERLVMTRIAGTTCAVLPWQLQDVSIFQIWVDSTYAVSLWESLLEICQELEGKVLGIAPIFGELRTPS